MRWRRFSVSSAAPSRSASAAKPPAASIAGSWARSPTRIRRAQRWAASLASRSSARVGIIEASSQTITAPAGIASSITAREAIEEQRRRLRRDAGVALQDVGGLALPGDADHRDVRALVGLAHRLEGEGLAGPRPRLHDAHPRLARAEVAHRGRLVRAERRPGGDRSLRLRPRSRRARRAGRRPRPSRAGGPRSGACRASSRAPPGGRDSARPERRRAARSEVAMKSSARASRTPAAAPAGWASASAWITSRRVKWALRWVRPAGPSILERHASRSACRCPASSPRDRPIRAASSRAPKPCSAARARHSPAARSRETTRFRSRVSRWMTSMPRALT